MDKDEALQVVRGNGRASGGPWPDLPAHHFGQAGHTHDPPGIRRDAACGPLGISEQRPAEGDRTGSGSGLPRCARHGTVIESRRFERRLHRRQRSVHPGRE